MYRVMFSLLLRNPVPLVECLRKTKAMALAVDFHIDSSHSDDVPPMADHLIMHDLSAHGLLFWTSSAPVTSAANLINFNFNTKARYERSKFGPPTSIIYNL